MATITSDIKTTLDKSILCWLATASADGMPNVSPKEIFNYFGDHEAIIANIASPNSVKNIQENPNVCMSFIDVFVQKGFQLKGQATIIQQTDDRFSEREKILVEMTGGKFPFATITSISVASVKKIIAPSYLFFPETTTEEQQVADAKKAYGL